MCSNGETLMVCLPAYVKQWSSEVYNYKLVIHYCHQIYKPCSNVWTSQSNNNLVRIIMTTKQSSCDLMFTWTAAVLLMIDRCVEGRGQRGLVLWTGSHTAWPPLIAQLLLPPPLGSSVWEPHLSIKQFCQDCSSCKNKSNIVFFFLNALCCYM